MIRQTNTIGVSEPDPPNQSSDGPESAGSARRCGHNDAQIVSVGIFLGLGVGPASWSSELVERVGSGGWLRRLALAGPSAGRQCLRRWSGGWRVTALSGRSTQCPGCRWATFPEFKQGSGCRIVLAATAGFGDGHSTRETAGRMWRVRSGGKVPGVCGAPQMAHGSTGRAGSGRAVPWRSRALGGRARSQPPQKSALTDSSKVRGAASVRPSRAADCQ